MSSTVLNSDQKQVWDTVVRVSEALIQKDAQAFENLLTADFVGATPTGAFFDKAGYINHHCNSNFGVVGLSEANIDDASIRLYNNTAVVNRRVHSYFKPPVGDVVDYDVQRIEVLVKVDGEWKMASGQGTKVIAVN
jgi:hypothetical protein